MFEHDHLVLSASESQGHGATLEGVHVDLRGEMRSTVSSGTFPGFHGGVVGQLLRVTEAGLADMLETSLMLWLAAAPKVAQNQCRNRATTVPARRVVRRHPSRCGDTAPIGHCRSRC